MTHKQRANAEDPRIKRTHQLILEAMIELTAQKGFSTVTVRDITKYAGINRATFYRHYQDKFDLLDQYARAVYQLAVAPTEAGSQKSIKSMDKPIAPGMVKLFEHIRANARFFRVMLGKNGDPAFSEKIRQYMQKRLQGSLPKGLRNEAVSLDLYMSYISSGALGALKWWLENDMPYSPEEMAAISDQLTVTNINVMFG